MTQRYKDTKHMNLANSDRRSMDPPAVCDCGYTAYREVDWIEHLIFCNRYEIRQKSYYMKRKNWRERDENHNA